MTYIVVQGTRAAMAWRKAAAEGDVKVIRDIVEDTISVWRSAKRPKPVPVEVWRGVQSMQIVEVGPEFVRVSCQAEGDYKFANGRWVETSSPLQEGIAITARAADMLFYELPHFKAERIQIDIYTSFRDQSGVTQRSCILSSSPSRADAAGVDWDEWTAAEIVDALGGEYRLGENGQPLPIEVARPAVVEGDEADVPPAPVER
ncbi:MAG TPA: hypothetical protein VGR43_06375 [Dehalococcoidia bacterium]|nr:hypothetical protein [Dehalococcoidia bacterium]